MKKLYYFIATLFLCLLSACGISDKDIHEMEKNAQFFTERWDVFAKTSLSDVRSGSVDGTDSKYIANFTTTIDKEGHKVVMNGEIGFNKFNNIAMTQGEQSKLAVILKKITVDGIEIPVSEVEYNIPDIMSNTEYTSQDANATNAKDKQNKAVKELKSWGADDAYFDEDGYLVYVTSMDKLSDAPNNVAKNLYPMFEDTPGIKGIKIVSSADRNVQLGIYTVK